MPKFFSSFRPLPSSVRWFRKNSGSVLILVVALIVILALLGTAFVATARIDRYNAGASGPATIINAQFTQLQTEICSDIANGLYDQTSGNYRPVSNYPTIQSLLATPPTYGHFDTNRWYAGSTVAPIIPPDANEWDTWLADRIPDIYSTAGSTNIIWHSVTRLPGRINDTSPLTTPLVLALPYPPGYTPPPAYNPWGYYPPGAVAPFPSKTAMIPTAIAVTSQRNASENLPNTPKVYPAFIPVSIPTVGPAVFGSAFLAADADGDGIADSLLFPLNATSSSANGTVTYFAAVRIVDNNSAVNLNTAWSRYSDFSFAGTISSPTPTDALAAPLAGVGAGNLGWFPSHVGLLEMLDPQAAPAFPAPAAAQNEMASFNSFRFNTNLTSTVTSGVRDGAGLGATAVRADYQYLTLGDALWNELGRRIQNPGQVVASGASASLQAANDRGELAFRFNLIDPSANPNPQTNNAYATAVVDIAQSAPTAPEQKFFNSLYADAINWTQFPTYNRWSVYPADKSYYWFDYNFNTGFLASANLTGANGAVTHDNEGVAASNVPVASSYRNLRSMAVTTNPVSNVAPIHSNGIAYPLVQAVPRLVPAPPVSAVGAPILLTSWAQQYMAPYTNPAIFPNAPGAAAPIKASLNTDQFPVLWRAFWNVMCDDNNPASIPFIPGSTTASYPAVYQIFTDPPDVSAGTLFTGGNATSLQWLPYDQLLIRAAIAAVNVEGLRDQTDNVISRHLILPDGLDVEVFSNKPQPYIQSYSTATANPTVTLCNPMQTKVLTVGLYQLAYYDPTTPTIIMKTLTTNIGAAAPFPINIAAGGTFPIQITGGLPPTPNPNAEIFLLRTRGAAAGTNGTVLTDSYNEGTPGDNVPIDVVPTTPATRITTPTADWSVVQAVVTGIPFSTTNRPQIQIFNDDFPGPYSPNPVNVLELAGGKPKFPFGAFARTGDVLKVPFIGSYRVTKAGTPYYIPVSLDCAACNTQASAVTTGEQIGHFCPPTSDPTATAPIPDYDWTKKIFDYFTAIQNPGSDYSPNVNPNFAASGAISGTAGISTWQTYTAKPPTAIGNTPSTTGSPNNNNAYDVAAPLANPNASNNEDNIGVDGLININTAPWQVLASLPMVPAGTPDPGGKYTDANIALAHAIVFWRDGDGTTINPPHGPFKSIFDLNQVTDGVPKYTFQNGWGSLGWTGTAIGSFDSGPDKGDFSPYSTPDGLTQPDFEKKFLILSNISNLITTRSDTFTCYVVVQGWLNAGTNNPILVAQQRSAFIANRVAVGPGNTTVQTTSVPSAP